MSKFRTIPKNVIRLKWNSANKTKHNKNIWYLEQSKTENFKYKSNAERVECLKCIKLWTDERSKWLWIIRSSIVIPKLTFKQ